MLICPIYRHCYEGTIGLMENCFSLLSFDVEGDNEEEVEGDNEEEVEVGNMPEEQCEFEDDEVQLVSIVDELKSKLAVGTIMSSIEDAYLLYCQYAHAKGFSVRKGDQRYFPRTNEIQSKEFECWHEGSKDEKASSKKLPVYQKSITRTNCKARLRISREKRGDWRVCSFITENNHEMVAADQAHLLRLARNISCAKKSTLEALVKAEISVSNAISFIQKEAHGPQNLGFILKDAYNHIDHLKRHAKVENGDANTLVQNFTDKSNKETGFYWSMQLDDNDRIMNFFFRDYRCAIDHECFEDVLSVDTIYRTNKYNLICAPFVGFCWYKSTYEKCDVWIDFYVR